MERLSALDTSFLYLEEPHLHMHVGSLAIFDPGGVPGRRRRLSMRRLRAICEQRMHLLVRWRQRVMFPPLDAGRPVWVDDPHFDLDRHLGRLALPPPGGTRQLCQVVGEVHSAQLDRSRPLWEMYLIDGLEDGYQGILTKTHHAMLDGVGGMDLVPILLDVTPEAQEMTPPPWNPQPLPTPARLLSAALADGAREREAGLAALARMAPQRALREASSLLGSVAEMLGRGFAPATPFNVPVGATRRFAMAERTLEEAKAVRRALGGTVNDVVLCGLSGAVARLLEHRGEAVEGMTMRAMMPVNTRTERDRGTLGNRVGLLFPDLPVWPMPERDRLVLVREATRQVKSSDQARAAAAVVETAGWLPPAVHREAARFGNAHVRLFNLVGSNIPGPQVPLYLDGMPLVAYYPLMPLGARVALSVAVITLVGVMGFGFTADWEAFPDLDLLALGLHDAFDELAKAAEI